MKHLIYPSRQSALAQEYKKCQKYPHKSLNLLMEYIKKYKAIIEDKLCVNYGIDVIFLLETKILWEWSEKLHIIIDYVNNQYQKYLNTLKNKFTDGISLRQPIQ